MVLIECVLWGMFTLNILDNVNSLNQPESLWSLFLIELNPGDTGSLI